MERLRTFAFPHAGGAAYSLRPLTLHAKRLELIAQDYPGHGRRSAEPLLNDLEEVANDAFGRLRSQLVGPYVLMGHSMGARVAMEVARRTVSENLQSPIAVVVAGVPAPGCGDRPDIRDLPDAEFIAELKELGGTAAALDDPAITEVFLPILRADIHAVETWSPVDAKLPCPIVALNGREDDHDREDVLPWRQWTRSVLLVEELQGGHFFLYEDPSNTMTTLETVLSRILTAR